MCTNICATGTSYCAGACIMVNSKVNCGACGHACTTAEDCKAQTAGGYACECGPAYQPCPGSPACIDRVNDPQNCGACGAVCPANKPNCMGGMCAP
jgi:hypothetical protein